MKRFIPAATILLPLDGLAVYLVFNAIGWVWGIAGPPPNNFWIGVPLLVPFTLMVIGFFLIDGYRGRTAMLSSDYTSEHLISLIFTLLASLLIIFAFVTPESRYGHLHGSRGVTVVSFFILMPVTLVYRRAFHLAWLRARRAHAVVFVGDTANCEMFATECKRVGLPSPVIYVSDAGNTLPPFGVTELLSFEKTLAKIEAGELAVEAVVLRESARELGVGLSQRLVELYFRGVPTYTLELFYQLYWRRIPLYRLNQTWLFQEGFQIAREPAFERIKRLTDIGLASVGLVLAAPFLAAAGLAIWLEDRGPMIFRQSRVGRNHVPFKIFKLRTMGVNSGGDRYTQPGDKRVTRVGRFLRTSRLDEFPQLLNVLRGEMSMIGPRAEWDVLVEQYAKEIPCYHFRHLVKPGITGWAQVNYNYGASKEDTLRKLEYDLYYIRHFSFLIDATIFLKTIHTIIFGKGQ
jgi:exopolysaccharide biosynthesis polyprenyl glycosylphosphotransferase